RNAGHLPSLEGPCRRTRNHRQAGSRRPVGRCLPRPCGDACADVQRRALPGYGGGPAPGCCKRSPAPVEPQPDQQEEQRLVITLDPELEAALKAAASHRGVSPEALALMALRERFLGPDPALQPRDEWERGLLKAARDWGVSLPDWALGSEGLYD